MSLFQAADSQVPSCECSSIKPPTPKVKELPTSGHAASPAAESIPKGQTVMVKQRDDSTETQSGHPANKVISRDQWALCFSITT